LAQIVAVLLDLRERHFEAGQLGFSGRQLRREVHWFHPGGRRSRRHGVMARWAG
jgi:hypothetical protein